MNLDQLFDELSHPAPGIDWPDPAALRRTGERRRTVRRASVAALVAAAAAVAVAVPAASSAQRGAPVAPASKAPSPPPRLTAVGPLPTAAVATTLPDAGSPLLAGETVPTGQRRTFGNVSLVVPPGWRVRLTQGPAAFKVRGAAYHRACIYQPTAVDAPSLYGCQGLDLWYAGFLPGAGGSPYNSDRNNAAAWSHGSATAVCPTAPGQPAVPAMLPLAGPDQSRWTFPLLGERAKATYNVWDVSCADGTTVSPQAWFLPKSMVVFFLYAGNPSAQALLSTVVADH